MISGIYVIENTSTGHRYVGSAVNVDRRRSHHYAAMRRGEHRSVVLQRAFNKHGEDTLRFRVLLLCEPHNLLMYEQRAIDAFAPEYNICKVAGSRLGAKYSEEARARLSALRKAQPRSPAQLAHLAALSDRARGKAGRPIGADERERIAAALRGRKLSPDHVQRIRDAATNRPHTEEARQKIAAAKRAYWAAQRAKVGTQEV